MSTLKPFNLEECIAGKKVVTRDGKEFKFGVVNKAALPPYRLVGWVNGVTKGYSLAGEYNPPYECGYDLFMAPEETLGYRNVYQDVNFKSLNAESLESAIRFSRGLEEYHPICILKFTTIDTKTTVEIVHEY